ncbi:unnamed protein product [Aphanomyces euteiches]
MVEGTSQRVLLSQDVLRCICSYQSGMDGAVKYLYEATKPLLGRLNLVSPWSKHDERYERCRKERLCVMYKLYHNFFKPWCTSHKAVQLLQAAHRLNPMLEYLAMLSCDASLLKSLHQLKQLNDSHSGEMLAFIFLEWLTNDSTVVCDRQDILSVRTELARRSLDYKDAMTNLVYFGSLEGAQNLHRMAPGKYGSKPVDIAAAHGRLDFVQFFRTTTKDNESTNAMDLAATNGHMNVVRYLHENSTVGATTRAMDGAAANGHLEIVHFLHRYTLGGCSTDAVDSAATNGHLNVVKFLITHRSEGHTTDAMDGAAAYGHLDILRVLHARKMSSRWTAGLERSLPRLVHARSVSRACTANAMGNAAANGHLNVVRFLHEHCREECTEDAIKKAAANGHLNMIRFLVEQRRPTCINKVHSAICEAVKYGHVQVVKFFLDLPGKSEPRHWFGYMHNACHEGHIEVVQVLWTYQDARRRNACLHLETAARRGHLDIVRFFVEQNRVEKVQQAVVGAATNGHLAIVKFLIEANFVEQVQQAVDGAASNGHLEVVRLFVDRGFQIDLQRVFIGAVRHGHLNIVKYCNIDVSNQAMYEAARHSQEHIVRFFFEQSDKLKSRKELLLAAFRGNGDCLLDLWNNRPMYRDFPVREIPYAWQIRPRALSRYLIYLTQMLSTKSIPSAKRFNDLYDHLLQPSRRTLSLPSGNLQCQLLTECHLLNASQLEKYPLHSLLYASINAMSMVE